MFLWSLVDIDILDINMNASEMWELFPDKKDSDCYQSWAYGAAADQLADLTLRGIKSATASAYPFYEIENEPLPTIGEYSIILNGKDEAVCIIQTTNVELIPFKDVDAHHAYLEGEGDRSLDYWRKVHEEFFTHELQSIHQTFDENMIVVCEKFKVVYPK